MVMEEEKPKLKKKNLHTLINTDSYEWQNIN